jgi:glycosyltransferase involved in cell wall biosynthesis
MPENALVSIICPIRTGENVEALIKSIRASTYKEIEIILIEEGLERSKQRNKGIKLATGEFLLILDSDQNPHPKVIEECLNVYYFDRYCGGIYIPEVIKTKGFFGYLRNWERQFYTGTAIDCVRFVKRENCPLFDEELNGPEDADWNRRLKKGKALITYPLYHWDNISFWGYMKKKAYYSKSMKLYAKKNPDDKVLKMSWRCWGVFVEQGKWKRFFARPDLAVCVLATIFIRGIIYRAVTLSSK